MKRRDSCGRRTCERCVLPSYVQVSWCKTLKPCADAGVGQLRKEMRMNCVLQIYYLVNTYFLQEAAALLPPPHSFAPFAVGPLGYM